MSEPKETKKKTKTEMRQEIFARNYVIDLNGTRSAIAAGYNSSTAAARASQLLTNRNVQRLVATLQAKRASKLEVTAERVTEELRKLAFSNMADYIEVDEDGRAVGLNLGKLDREQAAAIQEIREDSTGGSGDGERRRVLRTTFKIADKTRALELLGKHLKMFSDKFEIAGANGALLPLAVTITLVKPTPENGDDTPKD